METLRTAAKFCALLSLGTSAIIAPTTAYAITPLIKGFAEPTEDPSKAKTETPTEIQTPEADGDSENAAAKPAQLPAPAPTVATATSEITDFNFIYNNENKGTIPTLVKDGKKYVPLTSIANGANYAIMVDSQLGIANGYLESPTNTFTFALNPPQAVVRGVRYDFEKQDAFSQDGDIFIQEDLITRLFTLYTKLDNENNTFYVSQTPVQLPAAITPEDATTTEAESSVPPVAIDFDDVEGEVIPTEEISEESAALLLSQLNESPPPPASNTSIPKGKAAPPPEEEELDPSKKNLYPQNYELHPFEAPALNDSNLIVVQATIARKGTNNYFETYTHPEGYYIPLDSLTRALEFAIRVDPEQGTSTGWFINEERKFNLDLNKKTITSDGKTVSIPEGLAVATDSDIYVDSALLSSVFPVDFDLNRYQLTLNVTPHELLPMQAREQRERDRSNLLARQRDNYDNLPRLTVPRSPLRPPIVDLNINNTVNTGADGPFNTSSYSMHAAADVSKMTADFIMSGTLNDNAPLFDNARIRVGRTDITENIFENIPATEFYVGDIDAFSSPLIANGGLGRGMKITNRDINQPTNFDSTDFVGNATPGWEVELYQNSQLLDFVTVGSDGRYEFRNVPLLYGTNTFRIVKYGLQGETQEEIKRFLITDALLQPGEFKYSFSADQKSEPMLPFLNENNSYSHPRGLRTVGEVEYGINKNLSARVGTAYTPLTSGDRHTYVSSGVRAALGQIVGSADGAFDLFNQAWASQFTLLSRVLDVNLRGSQTNLDPNFESESFAETANPLVSRSIIDASRSFNPKYFLPFSAGASIQREIYDDGTTRDVLGQRFSTSAYRTGFSNSLNWKFDDSSISQDPEVSGNFSIRRKLFNTLMSASLGYSLKPDTEIDRLNLVAQKNLNKDTVLHGFFQKGLINDDWKFNSGLTWTQPRYRVTGRFETDQNLDFYVGSNISFSFGYQPEQDDWFMFGQPLAQQGAIIPIVYVDENVNGIFDEGDRPLENVGFQTADINIKTDEDGQAVMLGAGSYETFVALDKRTLPDSNLQAKHSEYIVENRAGVAIAVNFPLQQTSDIDGTIYFDGPHEITGLDNMIVQLLDDNGDLVLQTYSEFDGFYLFTGVAPGHYYIVISEEQLESKDYIADYHDITIGQKSESFNGYDITVQKMRKPEPAAPIAPVTEQPVTEQPVTEPEKQISESSSDTDQDATAPIAPVTPTETTPSDAPTPL